MLQHAWWSIANTMVQVLLLAAAIIIPGGLLVYLAWRAYKRRQPSPEKKQNDIVLFEAQTAFKRMFPVGSLRARSRLERLNRVRSTRPKK
jgi:hypothetical protein